jgi:protein gp37
MADITKIQWCDSTVNPVMGCGGCELFPESPRKVTEAIDRAVKAVDAGWKPGTAAKILTELIHKQIESIKGHPGYEPDHHLDKLTNTNIWHMREVFASHLAKTHGQAVADAALHEIGQQITCYAATIHLNKGRSILNPDRKINSGYAPTFESLKPYDGRVQKMAKKADLLGTTDPFAPWKDGLPRMVFVSDMGDALTEHSPAHLDWLKKEVMDPIRSEDGRRHLWLWLTKRPQIMAKFAKRIGGFPENVCAMTTLTGADRQSLGRLEKLKEVDAHMRGLSVEPLWERIPPELLDLSGIDWLIVGGESGNPDARPFDLAWARELRDHCQEQGVAFFCKQLGRNPVENGVLYNFSNKHGGDWDEWPEDLRVREFPQAFYTYRPIPKTLKPTRPSKMNKLKNKTVMSPEQRQEFKKLDRDVREGAKGMVRAAIALAKIRQHKLFKAAGYESFVAYCEAVHHMSKTYAYSLVTAGKTYNQLSAIAENQGLEIEQLPKVESQLRELSRVKDPEQQCAILAEVIEEKGGEYTAADLSEKVEKARAKVVKPKKPSPTQRLTEARESFDRLREIVEPLECGEDNDEVMRLLKKLGKLLSI